MPAKGSVMIRYDGGNNIFVTDDFVDVMIENKNYRIKNGFGLSGKCGTNDDYTLSLDLAQGIYSYTAKTQIGRNLKGEVSVKSGYCTTVLLK